MVGIKEIKEQLSGCYSSIEFCSLAIMGDELTNIATMIKFSNASILGDEIEVSGERRLKLIKGKLNFSSLDKILDDISKGKLKIGEWQIKFIKNIDIPNIRFNLDSWNYGEWPVLRYFDSQNTVQLDSDSIKKECVEFGHTDIQNLVKYEVGNPTNENWCFFQLVAPIYSKIGEVKIDQGKLLVKVVHNREIHPLMLTVEFVAFDSNKGVIQRYRVPDIAQKDNKMTETEKLFDMPKFENLEKASIDIKLLHRELGDIAREYKSLRETVLDSEILLPPLFLALSLFKPKDRLYDMVIDPGSIEKKDVKKDDRPQVIFENAVCELLSAGGIPSIRLGEYENLLAKNGNVKGSADIISYDTKNGILFVISCKTKMPDKNSVDSIFSTSQLVSSHLKKEIWGFGQIIEIRPIIITSQKSPALKEEAIKYGVRIIDSTALEELFKIVKIRRFTASDMDVTNRSPFSIHPPW